MNLDSAVDGIKADQSIDAIEHSRECQATILELRRSTRNRLESLTGASFALLGTSVNCVFEDERVLDVFPRLHERLNHGGQQLSGGEQQMLSIGRALLTNPRLMILDEATEGLAPRIVDEIWGIVANIRATGISTLIVDRNYRAVLAHTDRALVLEKGRIVLAGESAALAQQPEALSRFLGV